MSERTKKNQSKKLSRRNLLKQLGVAALALPAVRAALVEPTVMKADCTPPSRAEECSIYQLLALWLVFSTNLCFPTMTAADISSQTGLPLQLVSDALVIWAKLETAQPGSTTPPAKPFTAASNTLNNFISQFSIYTPGQCPLSITTLKSIATLTGPGGCTNPPDATHHSLKKPE